uniref:Uncharacterized protein n=1 Tax=Hemiselmis tepida TaxID=464990 RepID=A0A7S0YYM5_9CRYP|mmetsp:Transcript_31182/g.79058  ORF Transcript_31182/g.79058 Transcript_31182/m.79058 type:complete len:140 (+) Transcript_31182:925-1344(+)
MARLQNVADASVPRSIKFQTKFPQVIQATAQVPLPQARIGVLDPKYTNVTFTPGPAPGGGGAQIQNAQGGQVSAQGRAGEHEDTRATGEKRRGPMSGAERCKKYRGKMDPEKHEAEKAKKRVAEQERREKKKQQKKARD